jgi:hypothetical protein
MVAAAVIAEFHGTGPDALVAVDAFIRIQVNDFRQISLHSSKPPWSWNK